MKNTTAPSRLRTPFKTLVLAQVLAMMWPSLSLAHEGDDDKPAAKPGLSQPANASKAASTPKRQADGSIFLPKPAQRQLDLRTLVVTLAELPRSLSLNGRVSMDPNAGGLVQALQAGRLQPGPRGLPTLGQHVQQGELLGYVLPASASLDRADKQAQIAELHAAQSLAQKRLARLRELADTVPRKDIEAAESELASLSGRDQALRAGLTEREPLRAPVSGVIAASYVVAGQVLEARERVFEIVAPGRLQIEALAYDPAVAQDVASAFVAVGQGQIELRFLGAARSLREQALPLHFQAQGAGLMNQLALGQSVKVVVQTRSKISGMAVPASALVKNAANQSQVWVKTGAEQFEPRVVSWQALDASSIAVTAGLQPGERVVSQAAALLNQIR